ncbi:MAG: type IV pilus twitching motility protein PilT [Thiohalospira sp.]
MEIADLLAFAVRNNASDLHLSAGLPPMLRIDGEVRRTNQPELDAEAVQEMVQATMTEDQRREFQERWEIDFSFELPEVARFRANVFQQGRGPGAAYRVIPAEVSTLEELKAPEILARVAGYPRGLVLVTGPTGSGKSTTLAAMVDHKNRSERGHILTIEDPVEFVHQPHRCLVNQREVHRDTHGFSEALRSALREDPDTILVGELRDLETIRLALTAAETGHLVFGTLHTSSAAKTIDRIIDVFPAGEKGMVRSMLAESLQAVVAQTLLPRVGGGRVAAHEILTGTSAVRNLIREDKVAQLYSTIQTGQGQGMQTLDQALQQLVQQGVIERETARSVAAEPEAFG